MSFGNLKGVMRVGQSLSSRWALAIAAATCSRVTFRPIGLWLLGRITRRGAVWVRYRSNTATRTIGIRVSQLYADMQAFYEIALHDCYHVKMSCEPEVIVDGGAHIGLFTLQASAEWPHAAIIAIEPEPRNFRQLVLNLRVNKVSACVLSCCLGGVGGSGGFFCRDALRGSVDSHLPFTMTLSVPIQTLSSIVACHAGRRMLIKLDIEGSEMAVLEEFLSSPRINCSIVGELHGGQQVRERFLELMSRSAWAAELYNDEPACSLFRAQSPVGRLASA